MANSRPLFLAALAFFCSALMTAQESTTSLETSLVQHLTWAQSEGAMRYEVVITGGGTEVLREETENNFVDVQLSPGNYRMEVTAFDFLGRPADTATTDFEVLTARRPKITGYSPLSFMLNLGLPLEIVVEGQGFTDESRFSLTQDTGNGQTRGRPIPAEGVRISDNDRQAAFTVPTSGLAVANYRIEVENPGGFTDSSGAINFTLSPERPAYFSLGYVPFFTLGGYLFDDFQGIGGFHPLGIALSASYLFLPFGSAWFGLELSPGFIGLGASTPGVADGTVFHIGVNIVGQFTLRPRRFYANVRLGAAIMTMSGFVYSMPGDNPNDSSLPVRSEPESLWVAGMTGGGSITWTFTDRFFAEAGVEATLVFDKSPTVVSGYFRPALSFGYRLSNVVHE